MPDTLLKIIVVDDERLVRELLKNCLDWEELGLTIVGECAGAEQALEMVDRLLPDIIFTDICMPKMDGLELCRRIGEKYPHMKTVILTGHEEFEYAKKGIKLGVADFILKPINDDEIRRAVSALRERVLEERSRIEELARLKEQLKQSLPFLREKALNELISSAVAADLIGEKLSYFGIKTKDDEYQVAAIEVSPDKDEEERDEERSLLLRMRCLELTGRYFEKDEYFHVFCDNSQRVVVLSNDGSVDLWECCEAVKDLLITKTKCVVCIGMGNAYKKIDKVRLSYREACDALRYQYLVGRNQVISFSNIQHVQEGQPYLDSALMNDFCFYMKAGLKEKTEELIEAVFHEIMAGTPDRGRYRVVACNFIANIMNVHLETGVNPEEVFGRDHQPFELLFKLDTLPEMQEHVAGIALRTISAIHHVQGKKIRKVIRDVKEYIDANFTWPFLTLTSVAKKFSINLSYLSRMFKEEIGMTFVDYLGRLRMERAIALLNETEKKAYQIAEEVGIIDPHYFSVCFKKHTGVSVNQYRKTR